MVQALTAAREILDAPRATVNDDGARTSGFVFDYDPVTVSKLEQAAAGGGGGIG